MGFPSHWLGGMVDRLSDRGRRCLNMVKARRHLNGSHYLVIGSSSILVLLSRNSSPLRWSDRATSTFHEILGFFYFWSPCFTMLLDRIDSHDFIYLAVCTFRYSTILINDGGLALKYVKITCWYLFLFYSICFALWWVNLVNQNYLKTRIWFKSQPKKGYDINQFNN